MVAGWVRGCSQMPLRVWIRPRPCGVRQAPWRRWASKRVASSKTCPQPRVRRQQWARSGPTQLMPQQVIHSTSTGAGYVAAGTGRAATPMRAAWTGPGHAGTSRRMSATTSRPRSTTGAARRRCGNRCEGRSVVHFRASGARERSGRGGVVRRRAGVVGSRFSVISWLEACIPAGVVQILLMFSFPGRVG